MAAEDRLFVLYTPDHGKPKGVVHTTAGYNLSGAQLTFEWISSTLREDGRPLSARADVAGFTATATSSMAALRRRTTALCTGGRPRASKPGAFWEVIDGKTR